MNLFSRLVLVGTLATLSAASAARVTLTPGQTGLLGERKLTVLSVQDNRCPPAANCIRAGEIIVKLLATQGHKSSFVVLQLPAAKNSGWSGVRLDAATFDKQPRLTFTDEE